MVGIFIGRKLLHRVICFKIYCIGFHFAQGPGLRSYLSCLNYSSALIKTSSKSHFQSYFGPWAGNTLEQTCLGAMGNEYSTHRPWHHLDNLKGEPGPVYLIKLFRNWRESSDEHWKSGGGAGTELMGNMKYVQNRFQSQHSARMFGTRSMKVNRCLTQPPLKICGQIQIWFQIYT